MTSEEFEAGYAERSGFSVEQLRSSGLYVERCDCGDPICEGWAMGHTQRDAIIRAGSFITLYTA
jgi:hypothetical protein